MGRPRKSNRNLPSRVYRRHGAYYFVDHLGKWHRLGATLAEMYRGYAKYFDDGPLTTMTTVFDKYLYEVIPNKAPRTQKDNRSEIALLRKVFGEMHPSEFRPRHGYQYFNQRSKTALTCANKEMALLSHVFTKCVEWGVVDSNPCKQIRKRRPEPRYRYVEDWEYEAAQQVMPKMVCLAMDLVMLTGLRPGDALQLERNHLTEEGIRIVPNKSRRARADGSMSPGRPLLIEWSNELRGVIDSARKLEPRFRLAIICNRRGEHYTMSGFNSQWYRHMQKAVADPKNALKESFQFRDLRAKSTSDDTPEAATARLGHSDPKLTARVYRRGVNRVKPLR